MQINSISLPLINFRKFIGDEKKGFCTTTLKEENCRLILVNIDIDREIQYLRKKKCVFWCTKAKVLNQHLIGKLENIECLVY